MKSKLSLLASGVMMSLMAGGALATADYCGSDGTYTSVYTLNNSTQTVILNTSDIWLNTSSNIANDCYGVVTEPNNDVENLGGLTLWGESVTVGGWKFLLKDAGTLSKTIPISDEDGLNPVDFTFELDATLGETSPGDWTLTVSPEGDLPIQLDFVVVLKAANGWAAYLFDDELISAKDNEGEYILKIKNNGGSVAGLSHMSIYARDYFIPDKPDTPGGVPEPGVLFLMGAGLLGLGMTRRRKSA